ncbi:MAG: 4'-phosphopantetheinyl transferase [Acidobacteria bacterium]|nr:MAG: 4'-phosphopantetheinyl transferase [Acidobacteriota bacterium]
MSEEMEPVMSEWSTEAVIPDRRSSAAVFSDLECKLPEKLCRGGTTCRHPERPGRVDPVALDNIRRANLPTTRVRVGASDTSLDLWYVDLDVRADGVRRFREWLSCDELAKAERFHSDLDRARYIVGRAALRGVLAAGLDCSPAAIRFSYGTNGKPKLEGGHGGVDFNLAHSGGDAVIAVADGAAVGVDIELFRPIADVESLARLVFSDVERRALALAPDPVSAFLNGWTRKEAYVKALGLGLTAPLMEITVSLSERAKLLSTGLPDQSVSTWRLLNVPHPRAIVALALGPGLESIRAT